MRGYAPHFGFAEINKFSQNQRQSPKKRLFSFDFDFAVD